MAKRKSGSRRHGEKKRIAVIGGGVGGLAVAYNLLNICKDGGSENDPRPEIVVFEKSDRIGGNADTARFSLGTDSKGEPIERWADLGVNDFNTVAYTKIVKVMEEIGYVAGRNYRKLEDSTSYYTLDGSIAYTMGSSFTGIDLGIPPELGQSVDSFMTHAANDAEKKNFLNYTVRQYIEEFSPKSKYDWDPRLGPQIIYPRINGMYFTDEVDPTGLPLRAVMHYYQIQEGAGGKPPNRMYFVGGAQTWIDALVTYMKSTPGIEFVTGHSVAVRLADNGQWQVVNGLPPWMNGFFDVVVIATHADDALQCFEHGGPDPEIGRILAKVKYLNGLSVAHTYTGILPPDRNAWKTYNILIHQPPETSLKPYTITYVCNRHQNDGLVNEATPAESNSNYDHFGGPEFFITVNSPLPIPDRHVLKDSGTGKPAVANLRHNVLNFACLDAQEEIKKFQGVNNGVINNLYFAGGWTIGAGLHEECWCQGEKIAQMIKNRKTD